MNHKGMGKVGFILLLFWTKNVCAQYKVEKLGSEINSSQYDEISPVITRDGKTLYFTRIGTPEFNRTLLQDDIDLSKTLGEEDYINTLRTVYSQIAERDVPNPVTSSINQDIWIAESRDGLFDRVFQPGFPINNALPNSVCSLSPDDHTIIVINHFGKDGSMYKGFSFIERRLDGSFSFPDPLFIHDFYSNSTDVNLSMSKDGDVIILSLNRKEGKGDNDLYVSFKLKSNLWSEPINLGAEVNSMHRELTPFLSEDKTRLFFSSNRPGGVGGTDIYVTNRLDYTWKKWSTPKLLPIPINSIFDDSNPVVIEPNSKMYFISRRDGTSDIFKTELDPLILIDKPITLRGTIRHSITNETLSSDLYYGLDKFPIKEHASQSLPNGVFEITLDRADLYRLSPRKPGFIGKNQMVDVNILTQSNVLMYEIDFFLTPLEAELKLEIGSINFEISTPNVLAQSFPELDRLAEMLNQNPSIQIRIEGHTDNANVDKFNELLDLSRKRAEAIKKYLVINKGIGAHRIGTIGYGGTRPISPNDSEINKARNRRVEIYITTQSEQNKKINPESLKDPIVRPIGDSNIYASVTDLFSTHNVLPITPTKSNPIKDTTATSVKHYGNIVFNTNELSIKESSFLEIRKLIDYLNTNIDKKIRLEGMSTDVEASGNTSLGMQRSRGVKEYLIFNAIKANRIFIQERVTDKSFPGVKVFVY